MPRHNSRSAARLNLPHTLAALDVCDFQRLALIIPSHHEAAIEAEAYALHRARCARQAPFAYPICSVVERYECVGTADGEVACGWGQSEGEAGGGVRVEGVNRLQGRVEGNGD